MILHIRHNDITHYNNITYHNDIIFITIMSYISINHNNTTYHKDIRIILLITIRLHFIKRKNQNI